MEDLRQKEIFKRHKDKYMPYISHIQTFCLDKYIRDKNIDICSERMAVVVGIDMASMVSINEKVQDAAVKCENSLYDDINADKYMYTHINEYPTFSVDRQVIQLRDKMEMKSYMCSKLSMHKEPGCIQEYVAPASSSWYFYMFLIMGVIACAIAIFVIYRRMIRREMKREISMQVSTAIEHYFSLNESKA